MAYGRALRTAGVDVKRSLRGTGVQLKRDAPIPLPRWIPPQLCQPVEFALILERGQRLN